MNSEIIDEEIRILEADLASVIRGESPEQPRMAAESTRLRQGINALHRVKTALLVHAINEAQKNNHAVPLSLQNAAHQPRRGE
jgi:hypothetical protein